MSGEIKKFTIGIDLGTTNSTIAWGHTESASQASRAPQVVEIPQIEQPGRIAQHHQLPSALYIPFEGEHSSESLTLPWGEENRFIVGTYAKDRASTAPDRVVLSAKSWLCNPQIDRKEAILPWNSEIAEPKISPFSASSQYLKHLKRSVEHSGSHDAGLEPTQGLDIEQAEVIVTVPASFDEVARNLTAEAAREAGLQNATLLEEPLAALYAWIAAAGDSWREQVAVGDVILVCDLGGGTADFSLVLAGEENGSLILDRLSVGDHILLGGDNMDLALAYQLRAKLEDSGQKLDTWQFHALIHEARKAKERMLSGEDASVPVTLAGRGSSLFASTLQVEATRDEVLALILDGFLPEVSFDQLPEPQTVVGIQELGLPFEAEPALTKHLAAFLQQSFEQVSKMSSVSEEIRQRATQKQLMPNVILFNGGVCKSALTRSRLLDVLSSWSAELGLEPNIRQLEGTNLDTAVAEGAAHYGQLKATGKGLRIRAGISRSYYLGLQSSMPAVPGFRPPVKGVCVVPQGMEEGTEHSLEEQTFSLLTGKEVEFRFFSSHQRPEDSMGLVLDDAERELEETARLHITLDSTDDSSQNSVPVKLQSKVTDLGTLELWMQAAEGDQRWKLEFDVRGEKKTPQIQPNSSLSPSA